MQLVVILLLHLNPILRWRRIVLNYLFSGNNEGIYHSIFDHTKSRNSLTYAIYKPEIRFFLDSVNNLSIGLGNLGLDLSLLIWRLASTILRVAELYLLVESFLPFCYSLFPLDLIKFLESFLGKADFRLLVRFNLL